MQRRRHEHEDIEEQGAAAAQQSGTTANTQGGTNMNRNINYIAGLLEKMRSVCTGASQIALGAKECGDAGLAETYEDILLDNVNHIQLLTLELTRLTKEGASPDTGGDTANEQTAPKEAEETNGG